MKLAKVCITSLIVAVLINMSLSEDINIKLENVKIEKGIFKIKGSKFKFSFENFSTATFEPKQISFRVGNKPFPKPVKEEVLDEDESIEEYLEKAKFDKGSEVDKIEKNNISQFKDVDEDEARVEDTELSATPRTPHTSNTPLTPHTLLTLHTPRIPLTPTRDSDRYKSGRASASRANAKVISLNTTPRDLEEDSHNSTPRVQMNDRKYQVDHNNLKVINNLSLTTGIPEETSETVSKTQSAEVSGREHLNIPIPSIRTSNDDNEAIRLVHTDRANTNDANTLSPKLILSRTPTIRWYGKESSPEAVKSLPVRKSRSDESVRSDPTILPELPRRSTFRKSDPALEDKPKTAAKTAKPETKKQSKKTKRATLSAGTSPRTEDKSYRIIINLAPLIDESPDSIGKSSLSVEIFNQFNDLLTKMMENSGTGIFLCYNIGSKYCFGKQSVKKFIANEAFPYDDIQRIKFDGNGNIILSIVDNEKVRELSGGHFMKNDFPIMKDPDTKVDPETKKPTDRIMSLGNLPDPKLISHFLTIVGQGNLLDPKTG
jgi:hypothetical protein